MNTAGQYGQTNADMNIKTVQSFINMLAQLQSFVSNPSLLQQLGTQAAAAYAITQADIDTHNKILSEAASAQATLDSLAQAQADLATQKAANDADYQAKLQDATNFYNGKLSDLATRSAALDQQASDLADAQTKLVSDQATLSSEQQANAEFKSQLDAREQKLNDLEDQINKVKSALGA